MRVLFISFLLISFLNANEDLPLHLLPHGCLDGQKAAKSHGHHGGGMKTSMYQLVGFNGSMETDVKYHLSNLEVKQLKMEANMVNLPRSMYDNYHALVANTTKEDHHYTSVYYLYKHGRPSRTSPTELTFKQKGYFEIIPNHLPREHDRYYGSKNYSFILKYKNNPVKNQTLKLSTLNGTTKSILTNEKGEFEVTLPNDFENVKTGKRANLPSYFILSSKLDAGDKTYHTTFSSPYHVNSTDYWNSIPAGMGVAGLGLIIGLLILWRRNNG